MKEVFYIARVTDGLSVDHKLGLALLPKKYDTSTEAHAAIDNLEPGIYQVQKFYEVS